MCAPPDTDPGMGAGPAHRDTVNSLVLETLLVIRTRVENKQEQESQKGGGIQVNLIWKAAENKSSELQN
mgnify:CR=1 FL=1